MTCNDGRRPAPTPSTREAHPQKIPRPLPVNDAASRLRKAAQEKAEAEKILVVKAAEAEAEAKKLQGVGIAEQRAAIIDGLRGSVEEFKGTVEGATAQDVMSLVLMTQYFDTMKDIGASSKTTTILMPHSPGSLGDLSEQIRNAMITAGKVA